MRNVKGDRITDRWLAPVLMSVMISLVFTAFSGCDRIDQRVDRNLNENVQVDSADTPSGGHLIEIDSYEFVEASLRSSIEELSREITLNPLPKTAAPEKFEFRLWTNLGAFGDPTLLIVRSNGKDNHADLFRIPRDLGAQRPQRENPAVPKSGWNKMLFEVRRQLTSPKGLIRDPNFELNRDEPMIVLEVLDKGDYRSVFYGKTTSFRDGRRLIKACEYLADELNVDIEC